MAVLNRNNCHVDPKSGGVIFNGSPELQEIVNVRADMRAINEKLDKLIAMLEGGIQIGREMENPGFSQDDDQKIQRGCG